MAAKREKKTEDTTLLVCTTRQCGWSKVSSLARRLRLKGFLWTHKPKTCRERKKKQAKEGVTLVSR